MLCPYLAGSLAADCNSAVAANKTAALNEATGIINFIRGCDEQDTGLAYCTNLTGLRSRLVTTTDDTGAAVTKTWKLGDIIHSTPVIVGPPRERYDVVYGDSGYVSFFQRYKDRRQMAYVGANDGMLHAFNAGFFTLGDDTSTTAVEQARFTTVPVQPGSSTTCSQLPCDASASQYSYRSNTPKLGAELWAFIPQDLLPHLRWLTSNSYDHVYYVDLKPKVTDVRIFTADADHPGGWGTILIGGFRMGGSCTNCTQGKSTPRVVTADFNGDGNTTSSGDTRVFLSSYFVMDVTNPEKDPTLLWVFRDKDLGLTTSEPAVLRVKPVNTASDPKTNSANEKWYVVFGTGPTHLDGASSQTAKFFVVDLKAGPNYSAINQVSGTSEGTTCSATSPCITGNRTSPTDRVRAFSTGQAGAFMGDMVTVDFDFDFRTEAIYAGSAICTGGTPSPCNGSGPQWKGAMYRLTTDGGDPDPDNWGLSSAPTKLISTFAYTTSQAATCANASPCKLGPALAAPTLSSDDNNNLWVFFGTGRFLNTGDKTNSDIQHYFGVKDCIATGGCSDQTVERNNLQNVSGVTVCTSCASTANVSTDGGATYTGGFSTGVSSLVNNVQNADGWFTTLPTTKERNLSVATILGGTVFFTTFVPTSDICGASGDGHLYALYYLTGTAYTQSSIGETAVGSNTVAGRSISLGAGLPSQMAIQLGAQGSGTDGTVSSAGCTGGLTGFIQASTGALGQICGHAAETAWSRMIAWRDL
jgi:type IV pilus assembly protein PilY1